MNQKLFWWVLIVSIIFVSLISYTIYLKYSGGYGLNLTGGTVFIQTNNGNYVLSPGTTITIQDEGNWIITETVHIQTSNGVIVIEEGTEIVINPEPEINYPNENGA